MVRAFLSAESPNIELQAAQQSDVSTEPRREKVTLLVIGSNPAVDRVIYELYRVGFAEPFEWSQPLPANQPGEVMRVLTRFVLFER